MSWGERNEFAWRRIPGVRRRTATVTNRLGQQIRIRLDSLGDLHAAFGRRDEKHVTGILEGLPAGGIVLDIGAHIGGFSLIAAQAVGRGGRVFALEPISANVQLLEHNAKINGLHWLTPVRTAVGRKVGSIDLLVSDADTMWATSRAAWADFLHCGSAAEHALAERVPLVTLDEFLAQRGIDRITLVKIDVEAAEMDVLGGAARTLSEGRVQQLIIEVHMPAVKWMHVAGPLERYGYDVQEIDPFQLYAVLRPERQAGHTPNGQRASDMPVSVALIGCGAVSERLYGETLDILAGEGLLEVVALVDPDPARTSNVSRLFPAARQYRDTNLLLADFIPELAIVATPHRFHASLAIACLERGAHVLCEKPLALSAAECDEIIEAAKRSQRIVAVGHFRRFYPSCQAVKDLLDSRLLGAVTAFRFLEGRIYGWPAQSTSLFLRKDAGGGVLIDTGVHAIDLLLWWLGDAAEVLSYEDDAMGGVEANCRLALKMARGAEGIVQLSRDSVLPNRYLIECERGWIAYTCDVVDRIEWGLYSSGYVYNIELHDRATDDSGLTRRLGQHVSTQLTDYFMVQVRNVVASIRGSGRLLVTAEDARRTVTLIETCYRKRKLLDMPWLSDGEVRRARTLSNA